MKIVSGTNVDLHMRRTKLRLASLRNRYILVLFYVSLNSIYCIVVSSRLFSPSIYNSCFVIRLLLPPPRLVSKLFAGGKVM